MNGLGLDLASIEQKLLPEAEIDASPHGDGKLHLRGVRMGWVVDLIQAVERQIDAMWNHYDSESRAFEQLNWNEMIPEPERPAIPRDQEMTGLFLVEHVVKPLTARSKATLYSRIPPEAVAQPMLFVSHCWTNPLGFGGDATLTALTQAAANDDRVSNDTAIWLDVLVYNQHHPQAVAADMETVIGSIGAIVSSFDTRTVLTRLWCLWELLCAKRSGAKIHVAEAAISEYYFGAARERFNESFISVAAAQTTHETDRTQILAAMEQTFGSLPSADAFVRRTILDHLSNHSDAQGGRLKT